MDTLIEYLCVVVHFFVFSFVSSRHLFKSARRPSLEVTRVGKLAKVRAEGLGDGLEEERCLVHNSDLGHGLLHSEADNGNHSEPAVLDLGELHVLAVLGGFGVKTEGVKAEVCGLSKSERGGVRNYGKREMRRRPP